MVSSRQWLSRATRLVAVLGFAAAACAPATAPPQTAAPPSETPTVAPTIPPSETPIPTATNTPFVPKASVKIVSQAPASSDIGYATALAVEQLSGPLHALGFKVEFEPYDDQGEVDVGVANARKIVADPQVLCGVGHYFSRVTINASDLYHVAGLAFISPSSTAPNVTDRGYPEINRVVGRDDGQGSAAAQFAQAQGLTTIWMVRDGSDYGNRNADGFKRAAGKLGLKVVADSRASVEAGNFESVAAHIPAAKPDMVYVAGFGNQAAPFFKQVRLAGYSGLLMAAEDTPALAADGGPLPLEGAGLYYTTVSGPASAYADASAFAGEFDARYGKTPAPFAAEAYDAASICLKAIEEASLAKGGELPTRKEVAQSIRGLKDFKGITGTYNFNKHGDPTAANYFVFKSVTSDPGQWSQNTLVATYQLPPPQ